MCIHLTPSLNLRPLQPQTPHNVHDMQVQFTLIWDWIVHHAGLSPSSILGMLNQIERGIGGMVLHMVLIQEQFSTLQKATVAVMLQQTRKQRYIQQEGALTIEEGTQLAGQQVDSSDRVGLGEVGPLYAEAPAQLQWHCSCCGWAGHNSCTCQQDHMVSGIPEQQPVIEKL